MFQERKKKKRAIRYWGSCNRGDEVRNIKYGHTLRAFNATVWTVVISIENGRQLEGGSRGRGHICIPMADFMLMYSRNRASLLAQLVENSAMRRPWFNSRVWKIPWRRDGLPTLVFLGFPGGSAGKEPTCNAGDLGSIPGLERSPGGVMATHSSILVWRTPMDREDWQPKICGVTKNWIQLSN